MDETEFTSAAKQLIDYIQKAKSPDKSLKELINYLDNSTGLWDIRNQINDLYLRNIYACEGWNTLFGQKSVILGFPNGYEDSYKKTKLNVGRGLWEIHEENLSFYYKLGFIYTEVKNSIDNSNHCDQLEGRHTDLVRYVNRLNSNLINDDNIIANKVKSSIYPEFITILGIFTAITFAIFGGINTISSISSNLKISSKSPQSLGNLLIGAAVLGIVLFGIITVLFAGISKIIDKEFKFPLILNISIIATLTAMFLVGCIFTFTANGGWYINQNTIPLTSVVFSIIVVIVVYRITYIFYKKYKSKQLLDEKLNNGSTSKSS